MVALSPFHLFPSVPLLTLSFNFLGKSFAAFSNASVMLPDDVWLLLPLLRFPVYHSVSQYNVKSLKEEILEPQFQEN
jgi:hypothetical protein